MMLPFIGPAVLSVAVQQLFRSSDIACDSAVAVDCA